MTDDAEATKAEAFNFLNHHATSWSSDQIGINWFKGPIYEIWQHMVIDIAPQMTSFGFQNCKLMFIIIIDIGPR